MQDPSTPNSIHQSISYRDEQMLASLEATSKLSQLKSYLTFNTLCFSSEVELKSTILDESVIKSSC